MSDATYVYCVVHAKSAPPLGRVKGIPGAGAPRLVDAGEGVRLVVSDAPLDSYSAEAIEARLASLDWVSAVAAAHEAVVERAGRAGTVVPMKLFTLFHDDVRALAHVKKMRRALDRVLVRIEGCEEWGLRARFDEKAARVGRAAGGRSAKPASGRAFLAQKREQRDAARTERARARAEAERLYAALSKAARDARKRPPLGETAGALLLDAAFLVPVGQAKAFREKATRMSRALGKGGVSVTLTGPWPAYNFIAEGA